MIERITIELKEVVERLHHPGGFLEVREGNMFFGLDFLKVMHNGEPVTQYMFNELVEKIPNELGINKFKLKPKTFPIG